MILVTGGAGFIGLNIAEQLSARGEQVVLYDLSAPPPQFKWKVIAEEGDVTNRERLQRGFARTNARKSPMVTGNTSR